jgi:hypothetical protein
MRLGDQLIIADHDGGKNKAALKKKAVSLGIAIRETAYDYS